MDQSHTFPAIAIDLDGVIWCQGKYIEGSAETLRMLSKDISQIDEKRFGELNESVKLPFFFLTNSGAQTEEAIADTMNQKLKLDQRSLIQPDNFVMNYTPIREELQQFSDKIVLIAGFDNQVEIMDHCRISKYITMEEYGKIYPQLIPNNRFPKEDQERTKEIVRQRLKLDDEKVFDTYIQVHAIILSYLSQHIEIVVQILCDVLSTTDGRIAEKFPEIGPETHIPVYSVASDYFFPYHNCHLIRLGFGMYLDAICDIYKKAYNRELQVIRCGKPHLITFKYAENKAIELAQKHGLKISKFYMIGDNPHTDIVGANKLGWETILVRSGVYQGQEITVQEEKPTIIKQNFKEAIEYIFQQEGIHFELE